MTPTVGESAEPLWSTSPTRSDAVARGAAPGGRDGGNVSASVRPRIVAEWALWGKDAHETGYHVLRCSNGALRAADFAETINRYSPGELENFPQYTVSWIPDARREPEYIALGVHELAQADPRQADGRSPRDAVGREIVFVRLFCIRYADLVRYADQAEHAVDYQNVVQAVARIQLPPAQAGPVSLDLPSGPSPIVGRGPVRRLAEQVATLLLTGRQICVLGADDVSVAERLCFIDTVMAMLPYGMRATMSAATWAGSTSQDLKLRLFFLGTPRVGGRLADGRPRAEDILVEWGHPEDAHFLEDSALLYQDWLKDVKGQAPALLAEQLSPIRFAAADIGRMVGNLPKDKGVEETLEELGESLITADSSAVKRAVRRLRRYLAGEGRSLSVDTQLDYKRRISRNRLLVDDDRLSPALKAELYGALLPLAFGPALTYAGYCEVEECAGVPLHASLVTALAKFDAADSLAYILAQASRPGTRGDKQLAGLDQTGVPASEPVDRVVNAVAAQSLRPAHGPIVLHYALQYLRRHSEDPGEALARHGYLVWVHEYVFRHDQKAQITGLMRVLDIAFDGLLDRTDIDQVFDRLIYPPSVALEEAVIGKTYHRNTAYVREQVKDAFLRAQGFPKRAARVGRRRVWARLLPWNWLRRDHEPTAPVGDPARFGGPMAPGPPVPAVGLRNRAPTGESPWEHPRTTWAVVLLILAMCVLAYLVVQFALLYG